LAAVHAPACTTPSAAAAVQWRHLETAASAQRLQLPWVPTEE
jgi:hypothetical protein